MAKAECHECRRLVLVTSRGCVRKHVGCSYVPPKRSHKSRNDRAKAEARRADRSAMLARVVLDEAQRQLAAEHVNWAAYWAVREWRRLGESFELDEFRSSAFLGLVRAAYQFNQRRKTNVPFKMFSQKFIVGNIRRFVTSSMKSNGYAWNDARQKGRMVQLATRVPIEMVP